MEVRSDEGEGMLERSEDLIQHSAITSNLLLFASLIVGGPISPPL